MSRPRAGRTLKAYGRYGSVGIELVLSLLIGTWLGSRADARFGTGPWLTLAGVAMGAYAGFRAVWKAAQALTRDAEAAEAEERDRVAEEQRRGPR